MPSRRHPIWPVTCDVIWLVSSRLCTKTMNTNEYAHEKTPLWHFTYSDFIWVQSYNICKEDNFVIFWKWNTVAYMMHYGVVCVVTLPFRHFCWCRGFCHRTESDLFLFSYCLLTFISCYVFFTWHFTPCYTFFTCDFTLPYISSPEIYPLLYSLTCDLSSCYVSSLEIFCLPVLCFLTWDLLPCCFVFSPVIYLLAMCPHLRFAAFLFYVFSPEIYLLGMFSHLRFSALLFLCFLTWDFLSCCFVFSPVTSLLAG